MIAPKSAGSDSKNIMQFVKHSLIKRLCLLTVGGGVLLIGLNGLLILVDKPIANLIDQFISTALGITGETIDRTTIEDYARIKLPQTATNIHAHTERGIDSLILLKFSLPPADMPQFLAKSGFQSGLKDGYNPLQWKEPDQTNPWWTPQNATVFAGIASGQSGQFIRHIFVAQTNPTSYIVYVEAYSM